MTHPTLPSRGRACLPVIALLLYFYQVASFAAEVKHVVVIGCDGLGALGFLADNAPNLHRMMREGTYTLHARGVFPTSSSPNWASMIMGAAPEQHGVTSNDWETNKFEVSPLATGAGAMFPTIFGTLRGQRPDAKIACVHDWDGFGRLFEAGSANLVENVKGSPATAARAIEVIRDMKPDFLFIHFDDVDHAGHTYGWKTQEYFAAVEAIDKLIGDVEKALKDAGIFDQTVMFMTADHGGKGKGHGGYTMGELEIPWIVRGPGIDRNHELKTHVNTYDLAPTIARIMSLKQPDVWTGHPVAEAFVK
jgi:predicted AlkP superfamily pyrophosphatase or phosphodiesterase